MSNNDTTFEVGETVRLARPEIPKATGRATIATLQVEDQTACVIWEPLAPKPLPSLNKNGGKRRLKRSFLVTPLMRSNDNGKVEEEFETTTDLSQLQSLLEFERTVNDEDTDQASLWKERGDQLLRLGDASTACSYYEAALRISSILQVGSAVIVKAGGYTKVVDVDCLDDDDDNAIEVSMVDSGEEKVMKETEILLCILYNDDENHLQERLLLNLARCLLQLAELAKHQSEIASRPRYLRSAVLATTLALTIADHHKEEDDDAAKLSLTNLEQTSLLLRGQAQAGLSKFPNAITDIKRLLKAVPNHKEGMRQLQNIQGQQQKLKQVDKKLVKSMCKWVKTATAEEDSKL